jgi:hypothetical protein
MEFKEVPIGRRFCQRSLAFSEQASLSVSMKNPGGDRNGVVLSYVSRS